MAAQQVIRRLCGRVYSTTERNFHRSSRLTLPKTERPSKEYFKPSTEAIPFTQYGGRHTVSMLPGVGIGPELMKCIVDLFNESHAPVDFELLEFPKTDEEDPKAFENAILSIRRNRVAIKGNIETKSKLASEGSRNVLLRRSLDLFGYIMECKNIPGVKTAKKSGVDVTLIRENAEGEYLMLEHSPVPGHVESLKVVTRPAAIRIAQFTFDYCASRSRQKVSVVHNSLFQSKADRLFVSETMNIARKYPNIKLEMIPFRRCVFELEHHPELFDVVLCPNLYGVVLGSILSGLIGGPGLLSGTNYGPQAIVFEPGARNKGTTIQGKGVANPIAMIRCAIDLLVYLSHEKYAILIYDALVYSLNEGIATRDIGGTADTKTLIDSMIQYIWRQRV